MDNFTHALTAWREAIGSEHVLTDPASLSAAQTATFATTQRIPAIIRPGTTADVQACVRIANTYRVPIYPVSTGKNWGYGSRVPWRDGCVLMELQRLNRILDYDEKLAYVMIEPGVTFRQLYAFLQEQESNLMLSVISGTEDSSIVGNTLERGFGFGPYADHFAHVCALEVVLPTGECLHTGFGRFGDARAARLYRWGVGPFLDGLFTQSNLGIVTGMTLWLAPRPAYFQLCYVAIDDDARLEQFIDGLQRLTLQGVLRAPVKVVNDYRVWSNLQQYPWKAVGDTTPLPPGLIERIRTTWWRHAYWIDAWIGWVGLYAGSREQGQAERALIEGALAERVDRLAFVDETDVAIAQWAGAGDTERIACALQSLAVKDNPDLGVPSAGSVASTYWRKKAEPPAEMDPDRDRCGLIWIAPVLPFDGQHVRSAVRIMVETMATHHLEPMIAITGISARVVHAMAGITYDREVVGEDERALACHDEMLQALIAAGYLPYRLALPSLRLLPEPIDDSSSFLRTLKQALDPQNIVAPGRYGLGADRMEDGEAWA